MAATPPCLALLSIFLVLLSSANAIPNCPKNMSILTFFVHTIQNGVNDTGVQVGGPKSTRESMPNFGALAVMDKPITADIDLSSTPLGRMQGMFASSSREEVGLLLLTNFVFYPSEGPNPRNASTISVHGRITEGRDVMQVPAVGGTGHFSGLQGNFFVQRKAQNKDSTVMQYKLCYTMKK